MDRTSLESPAFSTHWICFWSCSNFCNGSCQPFNNGFHYQHWALCHGSSNWYKVTLSDPIMAKFLAWHNLCAALEVLLIQSLPKSRIWFSVRVLLGCLHSCQCHSTDRRLSQIIAQSPRLRTRSTSGANQALQGCKLFRALGRYCTTDFEESFFRYDRSLYLSRSPIEYNCASTWTFVSLASVKTASIEPGTRILHSKLCQHTSGQKYVLSGGI